MNEVDDYLLVQSASTTEVYKKELLGLIANLSPSDLTDLSSLRRKLNSGLNDKGLAKILDVEYIPKISREEFEKRLEGKKGIIDFALRVGVAQHGDSDLSDNLKQLQRILENISAELDDTKSTYILRNNETKEVFMEISYDSFKQSKRCVTDRGTYGFLKDTINEMLSKKYAGDDELPRVIGDKRYMPAGYENKLVELAGVYWSKAFKEMPKTEIVTKEKESELSKLTEEDMTNFVRKAVQRGTTAINIDKATKRDSGQTPSQPKT